jgi:hypothetical protein
MGLKFSSTSESQDYVHSQNTNGERCCIKTCKDPKKFGKQYCTFVSETKDDRGTIIFTYTDTNRVSAGHQHYVNQAGLHGKNFDKYVKFHEHEMRAHT